MQKEQLSALMDGEALDQSLLTELSKDAELQASWERYHLVRDTLRGDIAPIIHFDIAAKVAEAIAQEPASSTVTPLIVEEQPTPSRWRKMGFFSKTGGWGAQLAQVGVAACVSMAVIVGVQQYNHSGDSASADSQDTPAFNTLPMMGKASPVSLGVPGDMFEASSSTGQVQEQRARINAMLQDYELQRRLNDGDNLPPTSSILDKQQYSGTVHQ
ncbi:anti-sigma-E factor RseA [Tatumella sp. TA1]|uniref:anti-sigma-E factor RseA n=1 Tax=Rosenbergiella collisarenosi TaxID=1544695 RepID=UPI0008F94314|nr:anti-sigma-E factor RseA [Rosenbergiella collisarenosi]MBT0720234.1 anti-sigma-E factor RseA [Rosenbergiella collisarenosi]QGX92046.1 anti-sigma-E factor RseA [Tatumella sp. TA1]